MGRISFFTALLDEDISWRERDAINSAHDAADAALELAASSSQSLQRRVARQEQQITELRAMVSVLAAVLRDNGLVNAEILDARLEAALVNAEEEAAAEANAATCIRCASEVTRSSTVMTEYGLVCDRCHAIGG